MQICRYVGVMCFFLFSTILQLSFILCENEIQSWIETKRQTNKHTEHETESLFTTLSLYHIWQIIIHSFTFFLIHPLDFFYFFLSFKSTWLNNLIIIIIIVVVSDDGSFIIIIITLFFNSIPGYMSNRHHRHHYHHIGLILNVKSYFFFFRWP